MVRTTRLDHEPSVFHVTVREQTHDERDWNDHSVPEAAQKSSATRTRRYSPSLRGSNVLEPALR
jgi:hypothetical protein